MGDNINLTRLFHWGLRSNLCLKASTMEVLLELVNLSLQCFLLGLQVLHLGCFSKCFFLVAAQYGEGLPAHIASSAFHFLWQLFI